MRAQGLSFLCLTLLRTSGCEFERDRVGAGYYSPISQAGRSAPAGSTTGTTATQGGSVPRGSPDTTQQPSGAAGKSGDNAPSVTAGSRAPSSPANPTPTAPSTPTPSTASCDLSGRWLCTLHYVTDGLGNLQYNHKYIYYEIEQSGDAFTVKKGMQCGNDTIAGGAFAIMGNFSAAWPALMRKVVYAGRAGTSVKAASGCKIELAKMYTVLGATVPHYLDPSVPLPTAEEKATDAKPGWEDWDGDGNPGVTGVLSGTVSGKIFVATREWTLLTGTVPDVSSGFTLSMQWDQEPNVMAFDGSPFLGAEAVRAADATLHYAQFARLTLDQASGDDAAICKNVIQLAPTLTPKAAGM